MAPTYSNGQEMVSVFFAIKLLFPPLLARRRQLQLNRPSDVSRATGYRELPVTEKSAIPTITGKKAATVNKSSEDGRSTCYRVLPVRELPVTEKSAVRILTGKKPASNPVPTTGYRGFPGYRELMVTS